MTIAEIESTLQTLAKRHPNLDEALLRTLLTASGWEEKAVNEALAVFKVSKDKILASTLSSHNIVQQKVQNNETVPTASVKVNNPVQDQVVSQPQYQAQTPIPEIVYYTGEGEEEKIIPTVEEVPVVERKKPEIEKPKVEELVISKEEKKVVKQVADVSLTLPKNDSDNSQNSTIQEESIFDISNIKQVPKEPESLIVNKTVIRPLVQPAEIPENLPLRPFETTPHIWPFSKYKEVFHSEEKHIEEKQHTSDLVPPKGEVTPQTEPEHAEPEHHTHVEMKRSKLDGEDEGLIFLTGIALLVILLLLAYMYSNGRF